MQSQQFKNILEMLDSDDEANMALGFTLLKNYPEEFENYFHVALEEGLELIYFLRLNGIQGACLCYGDGRVVEGQGIIWNTNISLASIICIELGDIPFGHWKILHCLPTLKKLKTYTLNLQDSDDLKLFPQLEEFEIFAASLPLGVTHLKNLKRLELYFCGYLNVDILEAIGNISSLEILIIKETNLNEIPLSIGNLTNLKELYLITNKLTHLPDIFQKMKRLKVLDVSENKLRELPKSIKNCKNLKTLKLSKNEFSVLPQTPTKLQYLHLEQNHITTLSKSFSKFKELKLLDMRYNAIRTLPLDFGNLTNLYWVYLEGNDIKDLPNDLSGLKKLRELVLDHNKIEKLPSSVGSLQELRKLHINENKLKSVPQKVFALKKLRILSINGNNLSCLPLVSEKSNVRELYLNSNQITKLPNDLSGLKELRKLEITQNKLTELPSNIDKIEKLHTLDLNNNPIEKLPASLKNLKKLFYLHFSWTDLIDFPPQIIECTKLLRINKTKPKRILPCLYKKQKLRGLMYLLSRDWNATIFLLKNYYSEEFQKKFGINIIKWGGVIALFSSARGRYSLSEHEDKRWWKERGGEQFEEIDHLTLSILDTEHLGEFTKLTNLVSINFDYDQKIFLPIPPKLKTIPKGIKSLHKLKRISICNHHITEISQEVLALEGLEELFLENNRITEIPVEITNLKNLKRLNLKGNNIKYIPQEIIKFLNNLEQLTIDTCN